MTLAVALALLLIVALTIWRLRDGPHRQPHIRGYDTRRPRP
jgi:hypothetical protein